MTIFGVILFSLFAAAFVAWTWVCFPAWFRKPAPAPPATPQDEVIALVANTIKNDLSGWEKDHHRWTHPGLNFSLWVCNRAFGMGLATDGNHAWPNEKDSGRNNVTLTKAQQEVLWEAVSRPLEDAALEAEKVDAEEIILRVMSYYERKRDAEKVA